MGLLEGGNNGRRKGMGKEVKEEEGNDNWGRWEDESGGGEINELEGMREDGWGLRGGELWGKMEKAEGGDMENWDGEWGGDVGEEGGGDVRDERKGENIEG